VCLRLTRTSNIQYVRCSIHAGDLSSKFNFKGFLDEQRRWLLRQLTAGLNPKRQRPSFHQHPQIKELFNFPDNKIMTLSRVYDETKFNDNLSGLKLFKK